ncbi:hypothetical protein Sjap_003455 [Stephania japonica]|uniref:Receptor-like serine/threonine-protein kinase n=1 Tax=Stephania japonica TaxID=461633 RepID=A0AAP0KPR2_9MAGN
MRNSVQKTRLLCSVFSLILCTHVSFFFKFAISGDTITPTQFISDGQTLISSNNNFELGFFSANNSQNRYLGIWYKKISTGTVVWVANRDHPITNKNGTLKISEGNLVLSNQTQSISWVSNSSNSVQTNQNLIAQLLDSGNFVLKFSNNDDPNEYLWQSFDFPTDTLLPGMKLGWNLKTGLNRVLCSWKSFDDPSQGDFKYGIDNQGYPQLVMWNRNQYHYRSGSWNGLRFTGTPQLNENPVFEYTFVYKPNEAYYYTTWARNNSVVTELVVNNTGTGTVRRLTWNDKNKDWVTYTSLPLDICDTFNLCGAHGSCNMDNSPVCQCLEGFVPKVAVNWNSMDWSNGCERRSRLGCGEGEGFKRYAGVKLPDTRESWVSLTMGSRECEELCLKNCSCSAYASANVVDGTGCLLWFGNLLDVRKLMDKGQDLLWFEKQETFDTHSHWRAGVFDVIALGTSLVHLQDEKAEEKRLQHRNLVKLLGCCIEREERMLVYEYMPNKSLDFFIFDESRSPQLDWQKRKQIIDGIARGILYLHQDSRLRIVHRDLKASNILLDNELNPKISDFGLARSFGGDEIEANTSTIVGTYGYMSPEYTMDGLFSIKSDVFSFGVLVLEIVTGRKNRGFYYQNRLLNLLGHVWRLWNEGNPLELVDASIGNSCNVSELLRCMHVGLLCVQQSAEDRPSMSFVVLMLGSETMNLPPPRHPGYFLELENSNQTDSSSSNQEYQTATDMTMTVSESR